MKRLFLLVLFTNLLIGCSSDDIDKKNDYQNPNFNQVIISDTGRTACFGCSIETYDFQLSLLGEDISVEESGKTTGNGPLLRVFFYSESNEDGLPAAGVYGLDNTTRVLPFKIYRGHYQISAIDEFDFNTPYYYFDLETSQFEISYENNRILIDYNFNLEEENGDFKPVLNLSGRWDGDIRVIKNNLF